MNVSFRIATAALLLLAAVTDAAVCDTKGNASCDEKELTVTKDTLIASDMGIEKVVSAPNIKTLDLSLNNISSLSLTDLTALEKLILASNAIATFNNLAIPNTVIFLDLSWNMIDSFDGMSLPDTLKQLYLGGNPLKSVAGFGLSGLDGVKFPNSLKFIDFSLNAVTSMPVGFPSTVVQITATDNKLSKLTEYAFPSSIALLNFSGNPIKSIREFCSP
ncbi:unnamed protein product [Peronospora destructor]|uniref:Uncharacterized protein n=1 Tax=Peronospora destructor TaxID=86335 RepID=A0AAV0V3N3_9STRA|nr:unnamed protein product [Peronospora destructor]